MKIWNYFSDLGTQNLSSYEAKRVRLINRLCFILCTISVIFIFPWWAKGYPFMVCLNLALAILLGSALFLSSREYHSGAAATFLFVTATGFFVLSGMGESFSPLHYSLTSISALAIIFFKRSEKGKIIFWILYPLVLLFILILYNHSIFQNISGIEKKSEILITFDYFVNFCIIMTTILCFYSFYIQAEDRYRHLFEEHLESQKELNKEKAKAMANSKMAALGEMAGGIAHEINNPLFVIKATTSRLIKDITEQKISSEEIINKCQTINRTSSRISDIIQSLKTISGSNDKSPFQDQDIKNLIEDALILCQHRFHLASLPLNVIYETDRTHVKIRAVDFVQILVNLLNNAFDAVQGVNNAFVNIRVKNEGNFLVIDIEDNGEGIPAEIQDKVFDSFFTSKSPDKGTGLGLSLSRKLVQNNDGEIYFISVPGNTIFTMKFPHKYS